MALLQRSQQLLAAELVRPHFRNYVELFTYLLKGPCGGQRPEDSLQEFILLSHHVGPRLEPRLLGAVASISIL